MFVMSKRAGNPSEFKLNEMSEHLCKNIMVNQVHSLQLARDLRDSLIAQNIITANTTYFELKTDVVKLKLIKKGLSLGLNESIALSKYGLFIVSDFDLYHNMNTPKAYDSFLESLKFNKNRPEYIKLRQNRLNLDQFITRIKNLTVTNFGLIGTPSQEKPIKPVKTRADVASNIASDVKKLQLRDKKKARIDSDHTKTMTEKEQPVEVLEGEKDEGEDGLESDSEYEPSEEVKYVGSKRQSNRNVKGNGLPVSSEMSVVLEETTAPPPPLQGESCAVRIDKEYFSKLHSVKTQLSELFGDFKEGTTLMLKYDYRSEKLFVHGTESDDFIDWDNTLQFELRKNKVTYNQTDDEAEGLEDM